MPGAGHRSSSSLTVRPSRGLDDLELLHEVTRTAMAADKPRSFMHVGDVTWGLYQHEDAVASPKRIAILERGGAPVAFGILWLPQTLHACVDPAHRDPETFAALLDWFEGAAGAVLDVGLLASDAVFRAALEARGYAPYEGMQAMEHRVRSLVEPVRVPALPAGYRLRHATDADLEARVEVHRAAWEPSKFTLPAYRRLRTLPPYRAELDVVVEAPDRSFAAYALGWLDEENAFGELEPVGTHPAHRRLGLASAACLEAARRMCELGADTALVYCVEGSPACRVYEAAGFELLDRHVEFRRSA